MTCYDVRRKLSALLDGAGEPALRDAVARHVDGCAGCRAELEALADTDRTLVAALSAGAEPAQDYLDGFASRVLARARAERTALDDEEVRALADRALEQAAAGRRAAAASDLVEPPAALGRVVLPVAGPPPRRRARLAMGVAAGALALAGVVTLVLVARREAAPRKAATVAAPAAAAPASPPPAPPPEPAPAAVPEEESAPPARAPEHPRKVAVRKPAPARTSAPPASAPRPEAKKPSKSADEILGLTAAGAPAAPAPPAAAPQRVKLSYEEIKSGMDGVADRVQSCYGRHRFPGVVVLRVKIDPRGSVVFAKVVGRFAGTPIGGCVARAARAARFVAFDGPAMTIKYSFPLEADE